MPKALQYILIASIILIIVLLGIIGIVHVSGEKRMAKTGSRGFWDVVKNFENDFSNYMDDNYWDHFNYQEEYSQVKTLDKTDSLKDISVKLEAVNFSVKKTDAQPRVEINLVYLAENKNDLEKYKSYYNSITEISGNTLKIDYTFRDPDGSYAIRKKIGLKGVVTLYLPKDIQPGDIDIKSVAGSVQVENILFKDELTINQVSGSIMFYGIGGKSVDITSVSGSLNIDSSVLDRIGLHQVSGNSNFNDFECREMVLESVSGEFILHNLKEVSYLKIKSVSGEADISFSSLKDDFSLVFNSVSSDVRIQIPRELKGRTNLDLESNSGDIRPNTEGNVSKRKFTVNAKDSRGKVSVDLVSGDIEILWGNF